MAKMKPVFREVIVSQSLMPSGSCRLVSESGPPDLCLVTLGMAASGSSKVSHVPTAFGNPGLVLATRDRLVAFSSGNKIW